MKEIIITPDLILQYDPCYHPITGRGRDGDGDYTGPIVVSNPLPAGWSGTLRELLYMQHIPAMDRIWIATRPGFLDGRTLRLFAVGCTRRALALALNPHPDSLRALGVAECYANGMASSEELAAAAWDAAWAAAEWYAAAARAEREQQIQDLLDLLNT